MNTFMLSYKNKAYEAGIKKQILDMAINGGGIRETARVLGINRNTVTSTIKKARQIVKVNPNFQGKNLSVSVQGLCTEAELDEPWK